MLIRKLVEYAQREGLAAADPYFERKPVRWAVTIGDGGQFLGLTDLATSDAKRGPEYEVPKKVGGNAGGVATFGTDNPRFVLGHTEDEAGRKKVERDFPAFVSLIQAAAKEEPNDRGIQAAAAFLADSIQLSAARAEAVAKAVKDGDRMAIAYGPDRGRLLFETPAGREFWQRYRQEQEAAKPTRDAVACLACGEPRPPVMTNDTKLMGLTNVGGQPSGTALVSFDKDAFQSFGWDKNRNAAVCADCTFAYTQALNHLLGRSNSPRTRIDQAGTAFIFWADVGDSGVILLFEEPDAKLARDILLAASTRSLPAEAETSHLYVVGLRGNGGRAVVSDWFEVTLAEAYRNLARWFEDLQVHLLFDEREKGQVFREAGQLSRPPRLWVLCRATARDDDGVSPRTPAAILRAAMRGDQLPLAVAEACIARLPLDGFGDFFAPARIGLIRCTLNRRNATGGRPLMPGLDSDNNDPAYLCGRLLATLEAIQYAGVGDVGANIIDRFYGKASTAPALVFGQLMTLAQSHLGAISSDGQRVNLDRELSDIVARLEANFPRTLTLEEQGRFAIGYYHQKAHRFAELRRRRDERAVQLAATRNGDEEETP